MFQEEALSFARFTILNVFFNHCFVEELICVEERFKLLFGTNIRTCSIQQSTMLLDPMDIVR